MTIDDAYRFVKFVSNKDTRGGISPLEFNTLAPIAQIEAISDRLTNIKKINGRLMPQYGYKANRKIISELRLLLVGPVTLTVNSNMISSYPDDYFYPDSMHTDEYVPIEMLESDEYPYVKNSTIFPPDQYHPVAVFYGETILIDAGDSAIPTVKFNYVKYPVDPNWDYTIVSGAPVYNATSTPGQTGKVSQDFLGDRSFRIDVCRRILKYIGVNLDSDMVAQFAKAEEMSN